MRRRSLSVGNDSLSVMVPRSDKALVPMSAARVRILRKHLVGLLREATALKKVPLRSTGRFITARRCWPDGYVGVTSRFVQHARQAEQ